VIGLLVVVVAFLLGGGEAQLSVSTTVASDTATPAPADTPTPFGTPAPIPTATSLPDVPPPTASLGDTWTRPADEAVMVYVPAGEFEMGSTEGYDDEQPVHTASMDGFWIDKHEVTNAQFVAFLNEKGNQEEGGTTWLELDSGYCLIEKSSEEFRPKSGYADHPAVEVSWYGAKAYADWVGGRLPSEAEWEYAARGSEGSVYPWGDDEPTCDLAQYSGCSGDIVPVGSFPDGASWCGVLDMAGNVWEWTRSLYRDYPYDPDDGREDLGASGSRVVRGGAFNLTENDVRCAYRNWDYSNYRYGSYGFRVCVVSQQD
jgi:formylglycine-generating enzyme required for sulfatase activity